MANIMTPLEQAFNSFLLTMPPHRLESLLKYLNEARAHENDPNPAVDSAAMNSPFSATHRPILPTPAAPRSPALRGKRFREGKLRPLNSFIAFRSEYNHSRQKGRVELNNDQVSTRTSFPN